MDLGAPCARWAPHAPRTPGTLGPSICLRDPCARGTQGARGQACHGQPLCWSLRPVLPLLKAEPLSLRAAIDPETSRGQCATSWQPRLVPSRHAHRWPPACVGLLPCSGVPAHAAQSRLPRRRGRHPCAARQCARPHRRSPREFGMRPLHTSSMPWSALTSGQLRGGERRSLIHTDTGGQSIMRRPASVTAALNIDRSSALSGGAAHRTHGALATLGRRRRSTTACHLPEGPKG
jgi:hypothetical protein